METTIDDDNLNLFSVPLIDNITIYKKIIDNLILSKQAVELLTIFNKKLKQKYLAIFAKEKKQHISERINDFLYKFHELFKIYINEQSELFTRPPKDTKFIFSEKEHKKIFLLTTILKINFVHQLKQENTEDPYNLQPDFDIESNYPLIVLNEIKPSLIKYSPLPSTTISVETVSETPSTSVINDADISLSNEYAEFSKSINKDVIEKKEEEEDTQLIFNMTTDFHKPHNLIYYNVNKDENLFNDSTITHIIDINKKKIDGDGHCLFNAILINLMDDEKTHLEDLVKRYTDKNSTQCDYLTLRMVCFIFYRVLSIMIDSTEANNNIYKYNTHLHYDLINIFLHEKNLEKTYNGIDPKELIYYIFINYVLMINDTDARYGGHDTKVLNASYGQMLDAHILSFILQRPIIIIKDLETVDCHGLFYNNDKNCIFLIYQGNHFDTLLFLDDTEKKKFFELLMKNHKDLIPHEHIANTHLFSEFDINDPKNIILLKNEEEETFYESVKIIYELYKFEELLELTVDGFLKFFKESIEEYKKKEDMIPYVAIQSDKYKYSRNLITYFFLDDNIANDIKKLQKVKPEVPELNDAIIGMVINNKEKSKIIEKKIHEYMYILSYILQRPIGYRYKDADENENFISINRDVYNKNVPILYEIDDSSFYLDLL